jgi:hypothetical protein
MEEVLKTVNTDIIVAHTNYLYSAKELSSQVAHTNSSTGRVRVVHTRTMEKLNQRSRHGMDLLTMERLIHLKRLMLLPHQTPLLLPP